MHVNRPTNRRRSTVVGAQNYQTTSFFISFKGQLRVSKNPCGNEQYKRKGP